MSVSTPSLQGIPIELRLAIFEHVLGDDCCLTYRDGVISPIPSVVSLSQRLRAEVLPLYFKHKTVWLYTFGELGAALHFAPSTVPDWRRVHIAWTGRRAWTIEGKLWHLEPGLDMLKKIPNLSHLSLDTDTIQCGVDKSVDANFATEIALITKQVIRALPEHPTLRTVEITGSQAGRYRGGAKIDLGKFREVWTRRGNGTWTSKESVSDVIKRRLP